MVNKSIKRFNALSNLLKIEKKIKRDLAQSFLEYLDKLSLEKRVLEMESILYETEVKKTLRLNERLSPQESKCLYLAYKGKNVQETANILSIQPKTAGEYRSSLLKKLNAKTIGQAIGLGIKYFNMLR